MAFVEAILDGLGTMDDESAHLTAVVSFMNCLKEQMGSFEVKELKTPIKPKVQVRLFLYEPSLIFIYVMVL